MIPEERAKQTTEILEQTVFSCTGIYLDSRCQKAIADAIRAAVEAERAKYTKLIEAVDNLIEHIGLGAARYAIAKENYDRARKELP